MVDVVGAVDVDVDDDHDDKHHDDNGPKNLNYGSQGKKLAKCLRNSVLFFQEGL
jgi:hypothetical protein